MKKEKTIIKMHEYRKLLLDNNFLEPMIQELHSERWRFYKQVTQLTAFVVNLIGTENGIEIVYGYASTAFTLMKGDEDSLIRLGIWNEDINIRERIVILDESDTRVNVDCIGEMYNKYKHVEKEELLEIAKKKRKEFINKIAVRLKPLGFKKKGNTWKRLLQDEHYLMFDAQKSSFSDEYYFNVNIYNEECDSYVGCFYCRVYPNELCPLDWQLISDDDFVWFLENEVTDFLLHIINTPLSELGKESTICKGCMCERDKCDNCWVEQNMWENEKDDGNEI